MSVINTNITSMIGQSNLNKSQNDLTTAMERLSSGSRINSAKDDAAGQAIANRMSAQITGLGQAQRNANDGVSVAQTAEGALGQVNDNLQRIRELSVQAANGTNSDTDLQSIQDEIGARLEEIDRISSQTDFNGKKILGAGTEGISIQVGANDGESITINLSEISASTLGLSNFNVSGLATTEGVVAGATTGDTFTIPGVAGTPVSNDPAGAADVVGAAADGDTIVTDESGTEVTYTRTGTDSWSASGGANDGNTVDDATVAAATGNATNDSTATLGGTTYTVTNGGDVTTDGESVYTNSDDALTTEATSPGASTDTVFTRTATGWTSSTGGGAASATTAEAVTTALNDAAAFTTSDTGATQFSADSQGTIKTGTGENAQSVYISQVEGSEGNLTTTAADARTSDPLAALDNALQQVDTMRSDLGASMNRFETAIENLNTNQTNLDSARSRIEDADYAVEVSNMTRAQILQQAGTSVLAQANQIPQGVLSLLG